MEKFGINTRSDDLSKLIYVCMCGHNWSVDRPINVAPKCEKCDNQDFSKSISCLYNGGRITSDARLDVIEKGDWGFVAKKYRVIAKYSRKDSSLIYNSTKESTITFDFRNDTFGLANEHETESINAESLREFFSDIDDTYFKITVCTEKFRNFIEFGIKEFGRGTDYGRYNGSSTKAFICNSLPVLTKKLTDIQILCNAGCSKQHLIDYYSIVKYVKDTTDVNRAATKPHEIFMVSKYIMKYIIELNLIGRDYFSHLRLFDKKFGADGTKAIFQKMMEESDNASIKNFIYYKADDYVELVDRYAYNPQKLITYLFRNIKLEQGIMAPGESLNLLKDYMRMMTTMELNPDKYTKSLKKDHDIAQMNFKAQEDEFTKKEFTKTVESDGYTELEYKTGKHVFVAPKTPKEIVREGDSLSHCVASYVKDLVKGKCKIFFLRKNDELDKSLITIELRGNRIVQARGFGNRIAKPEEKKLIEKWADKKKLELAC